VLFGRPLIWLNYDQADREAALRTEPAFIDHSGRRHRIKNSAVTTQTRRTSARAKALLQNG
jgi:hypothetical protein